MLFLVLIWVGLGGSSFLVGNSLLTLLAPNKVFVRRFDRFFVSEWVGICVVGITLLALSLLYPLTPLVAFVTIGAVVGLSLMHRENRNYAWETVRRLNATALVGTVFLLMGVAAYTSQIVIWYDTGLYHEQAIKWLAEFGTVPGLALIHYRLGFSSSWFAVTAPFNHGFLKGRLYALTGGFCLFLMLLSLIVNVWRAARNRLEEEDFFLMASFFIAIPVTLYLRVAISSLPDIPVIVLAVVIAWAILKISKLTVDNSTTSDSCLNIRLLPFILSVGAVTIKLNSVPLIVVSGAYYLLCGKYLMRRAVTAMCVALLMLTPYLAANIITSGYPLYPATFLSIQLPWTKSLESLKDIGKIIQEWQRWGNPTPPWGNGLNWILPWLDANTLTAFLIALSLISLIVLIILPSFFGMRGARGKYYVIAMAALGMSFVLYGSPTLRHLLGYLLVLPSLLFMELGKIPYMVKSVRKASKRLTSYPALCLFASMLLVAHIYLIPPYDYKMMIKAIEQGKLKIHDSPYINLLLPPMTLSTFPRMDSNGLAFERQLYKRVETAEGFVYYRPGKGDQCWNCRLPCTPERINVKLLNPKRGLVGGFTDLSKVPQ